MKKPQPLAETRGLEVMMTDNTTHEHTWTLDDTYFDHRKDRIYDLYTCPCGEERENGL